MLNSDYKALISHSVVQLYFRNHLPWAHVKISRISCSTIHFIILLTPTRTDQRSSYEGQLYTRLYLPLLSFSKPISRWCEYFQRRMATRGIISSVLKVPASPSNAPAPSADTQDPVYASRHSLPQQLLQYASLLQHILVRKFNCETKIRWHLRSSLRCEPKAFDNYFIHRG